MVAEGLTKARRRFAKVLPPSMFLKAFDLSADEIWASKDVKATSTRFTTGLCCTSRNETSRSTQPRDITTENPRTETNIIVPETSG